jgi:signal transduction histidine kinase
MQSKEYKKMIERHILSQIEIGWDVLWHINKAALMTMVLISFSIIFLGVDESLHLIGRRLAIIWLFYLFYLMNWAKFGPKIIFENIFLGFWGLLSLNLTFENAKPENPAPYDIWLFHLLLSMVVMFIYCFKWKKFIVCFSTQKVFHLTVMFLRYGSKLRFINVVCQIVVMLAAPALCIVILKIMLKFLIAAHQNKKLADSAKNILQVFPECVIIRDILGDGTTDTVFVNNEAAHELYEIEDLEVNVLNENEDSDEHHEKINLNSLLRKDESKINKKNFIFQAKESEKIKIDYSPSQHMKTREPRFYTLKSIKVNWVDSTSAFMHVFVNTTDIQRLEKAKATNKCMHVMFSGISHELRTPLNAFINANEMIKYGSSNIKKSLDEADAHKISKIREMVGVIEKNCKIAIVSSNLLLNLTEDILDFAKIEAGIFKLNPQNFFVKELIEDICMIFSSQWDFKGLEFVVNCENNLRRTRFRSDVGRIKQIMINLISNSFKFTNQGFIRVTIGTFIERSFIRNHRFLKFTVEDSGIGISEQDQSRLFKCFVMVHKHRDEFNCRGTGLGLAITQKLVTLLEGEINLKSEENKGTEVAFTIKESPSNELEVDDHLHDLNIELSK